jgi:hypothetical protein
LSEPIRCIANVYKVSTLADHGIRVTLDMPESEIMQAAMFMECQRMAVVLEIEATAKEYNNSGVDTVDGKKGRPERKSLRGAV